jgi:SAM-dependent methyltransferase
MAHAEDFDVAHDDGEAQEGHTDAQYFSSYGGDIGVTKVMLRDAPRMRFYRRAIESAGLVGKVVVDVGAGTGILSLMAARAGARRVISIEASDMAVMTQRVAAANGYADIIRVVHAPAEEVTLASLVAAGHLLAGDKVDAIVSEWMGFYLLHENMLPSVLRVRDALECKTLIPSTARILAAPVDLQPFLDAQCRQEWKNVDGFDFTAVGELEESGLLSCNPCVHVLPPESVMHEQFVVAELDLASVAAASLDRVQGNATLFWRSSSQAAQAIRQRPDATLWGLAMWFDVGFANEVLRTGPADEPTHWKQCVVLFGEAGGTGISVSSLVEGGDAMGVGVDLVLNRTTRSYEVSVSLFDPTEQQ